MSVGTGYQSTHGASGGSGGASEAFTIIQPDSGTSPVADSSADTLTLTSSDATLSVSGDSATDTIDFKLNPVVVAKGGTNSTATLNNNRVMQSSAGAIVEAAAITASRALASDANGIPVAATTTATELGYVSGVTSAIQTQLGGKQNTFPSQTANDIFAGPTSGSAAVPAFRALVPKDMPSNVTVVSSSPYTILETDLFLFVDTNAARTLNLLPPATAKPFYIFDTAGLAGTNNITLVRNGTEKIVGIAASKLLQTNWGAWLVVPNGTDWFIHG